MGFKQLSAEAKELMRKKTLTVKPITLQRGIDRFPTLHVDDEGSSNKVPKISDWRLNLTRFSHVHNFFYAAYGHQIYVYEPIYPSQILPERPTLILTAPCSPFATIGSFYAIDRRNSHAINNLFVDFLGNLEIVLVACDDGDVIGYYSHDIDEAISCRLKGGPETILGDEVKPFFMRNVEKSAWGLSIHSKARKIAVSANTREVTVFVAPLHFPATEISSSSSDPDHARLNSDNTRTNLNHRSPNLDRSSSDQANGVSGRGPDGTFVYRGMDHNLPAVSLCNTDDDPNGHFLVAGDILGRVYVHDLIERRQMEIFTSGFCRSQPWEVDCGCEEESLPHAIWGLAFIDRKAFRLVSGYAPTATGRGLYNDHWDGSIMRACVPNSLRNYHPKRPKEIVAEDDSDGWSTDREMYDSDDELDTVKDTLDRRFCDSQHNVASIQRTMAHPWMYTETHFDLPRHGGGGVTPPLKQFRCRHGHTPDYNSNITSTNEYPSPLLVTSKIDISLLQPNGYKPVITLGGPLEQGFVGRTSTLRSIRDHFTDEVHDRMSMQAVIPELGALIIGTVTGRVGVFSLLRTDEWPERPDGTFFTRLDWLLPLADQERKFERPECKLIGLTVGPIQGHLGPARPEVRRLWRLMLCYADHSILSYEIGLDE